MKFKLIKEVAGNRNFRWGMPLKKYNVSTINQAQTSSLWDRGCEFVVEDKTKSKKVTKNESKSENEN